MTDVRLVATNPDDGVLVPVASNSSGQLAVQSPKIEKIPNDIEVEGTVTATRFIGDGSSLTNLPLAPPPEPPEFDGNLDGDLIGTGSATFAGNVLANNGVSVDGGVSLSTGLYYRDDSESYGIALYSGGSAQNNRTVFITTNGAAKFDGDVVIGSRGKTWLIRESNGVAMLVEQTRREERQPIVVRDLPNELDLVEAALNEIMEKLKMTPPAGWEVWDGSDNS